MNEIAKPGVVRPIDREIADLKAQVREMGRGPPRW